MKIFKMMFALLAICLASVSCEKNEMKDSNLYGKWKAIEYSELYYQNDKLIESYSDYYADFNEYYQFNGDGTGQHVISIGSESMVGTIKSWILLDKELVLTFEDDDEWGDGTINFKINEMTRTYLQISVFEEDGEKGEKYEYRYALKKL